MIPYPSDVVFHPVVTDPAQIPHETQKLEDAFLSGDGFGILGETRLDAAAGYEYTPLVIGQHEIGPAVVMDSTYANAGYKWAWSAFKPLYDQYADGAFPWDRSYKDYRVAVVSNEVQGLDESLVVIMGLARTGEPFAAIALGADNGRNPDTGWVLLHEMGHTRGLGHIDGNQGGLIDPNYPEYPESNINVDAYRVGADGQVVTLRREDYFDFMGRGWTFIEHIVPTPLWISAYHYRKWAESGFGIEPTLEARRPVVIAP